MPHQSAPVKGLYSPFKFLLPKIAAAFFIVSAIFPSIAQSVSSSSNADFEQGDFSGWNGQTGVCCPISTSPSGIVEGRHTIMSGSGTDPNTCDHVTVVAPGGLYSARIGNQDTGAKAEKLSYSLTIDANSALFIYRYAVVLEDPGHPADEQPRFQIRVLNAAGHLIDPVCGEYTVVASSNLPGFQTCNNSIVYKDWTTVGLDLSAYIGQTLTIEFATGDCTPGGHFGYAYVDAYCSPLQIDATYCSGSFRATLQAPIGFSYLWNDGQTTRSIEVNNPVAGATYQCLLTSVTGCTATISTVLSIADPLADFTLTNTCYGHAEFSDISFLPDPSVVYSYSWDFGDGSTSNARNPEHVFPSAGIYTVIFVLTNGQGCTSSITRNITVYDQPTAAIAYPGNPYCTSDSATQTVQLTGTNAYTGGTFSAPAGLAIHTATGAIVPRGSLPGTYAVSYTIPTTPENCTVPPVTTLVTITGLPTVALRYPASVYCQSEAAFLPVLTGTFAYAGGSYASTPGLDIDAVTGQIDPGRSLAGNYVVAYRTPAAAGCQSVWAVASITINGLPQPQLFDGSICVNPDGNTFRSYTLDTGLSDTAYDFEWFLDGQLITAAHQGFYEATVAGTYSVIATNRVTGCRSSEVFADVKQWVTPPDFIAYLNHNFTDQVALTLIVESGTGPFLFSIDGSPFDYTNIFDGLSPGTHVVSVTDAAHCTDLTKEILVLDYPRFFTPNNDGYHDSWNINALGNQPEARIYIYDRYGKLLKVIDPAGQGWDGDYNGREMPADDYWFTVDYREIDLHGIVVGKKFKSHFSIKR